MSFCRPAQAHAGLRGLHVGVIAAGVLLLLPGVGAAELTPATAAKRLHTSEASLQKSTNLSAVQLRRALQGAARLTTVSDEQMLKLLRHPRLLRQIPVSVEGRERGRPLASTAGRRPPRKGCRSTGAYATYRGNAGNRIFTFIGTKFWCWNKQRKRVNVAKGSVQDKPDINGIADKHGWSYDFDKASNFYYRYRGSGRRGAHSSYLRGTFKWCPTKIGCLSTKHAEVRIGVRWTGSAWENHGVH